MSVKTAQQFFFEASNVLCCAYVVAKIVNNWYFNVIPTSITVFTHQKYNLWLFFLQCKAVPWGFFFQRKKIQYFTVKCEEITIFLNCKKFSHYFQFRSPFFFFLQYTSENCQTHNAFPSSLNTCFSMIVSFSFIGHHHFLRTHGYNLIFAEYLHKKNIIREHKTTDTLEGKHMNW